ncbi:PAAR motif family protein [Lysobacter capsici]|jgi:uncharacterized Zn-binding protein involved in type VI secretion|uniref:PAAR domain-containing protein n=1 Tax=Lysobacter capsici AZ78 TaxID=1444315 RepID=A0A108U4P8_9GAMM|nr:PAAR domain-containing protein [Lysobacter capsici]ALN86386.1 PAAR motif family protein [Lysobacter capsici]KWS02505.1 hypothetical protein AZ78_0049 [Lysobacter capsici AZ78]
MMRQTITVGDTTSGGGTVLGGPRPDAAPGAGIDARCARLGDAVQCGVHGATTIVTGDPAHLLDGKAAARHGDFCACGCILISLSQIRGIVEHGRGYEPARVAVRK